MRIENAMPFCVIFYKRKRSESVSYEEILALMLMDMTILTPERQNRLKSIKGA